MPKVNNPKKLPAVILDTLIAKGKIGPKCSTINASTAITAPIATTRNFIINPVLPFLSNSG